MPHADSHSSSPTDRCCPEAPAHTVGLLHTRSIPLVSSGNHTDSGLRTRGTERARQRRMSGLPECPSRRRTSTAAGQTLPTVVPALSVALSQKRLSRARPWSAGSRACLPGRRLLMRGRGIAPMAYHQHCPVSVPSPYFLSTSVESARRNTSREAPLQPRGSGAGQRSGNGSDRRRSGAAQEAKRVRPRTGTSSWRTERRGLGAACTAANTGSGREVRSWAPRSQALPEKSFIFQLSGWRVAVPERIGGGGGPDAHTTSDCRPGPVLVPPARSRAGRRPLGA